MGYLTTKKQRQEWIDYKLSCPEKILSEKSLRTSGKNWFKDFQDRANLNMERFGLPFNKHLTLV